MNVGSLVSRELCREGFERVVEIDWCLTGKKESEG